MYTPLCTPCPSFGLKLYIVYANVYTVYMDWKTVREFRSTLSSCLDEVDAHGMVLVRRGNKTYKVSVYTPDFEEKKGSDVPPAPITPKELDKTEKAIKDAGRKAVESFRKADKTLGKACEHGHTKGSCLHYGCKHHPRK